MHKDEVIAVMSEVVALQLEIGMRNGIIEIVSTFKYLGGCFSDGRSS